jgi:hypothetical protein
MQACFELERRVPKVTRFNIRMPRNLRMKFFREFRLYLAIAVSALAAYFAYVTVDRGWSYALSMENLRWFGVSLLLYSAIAALVATLTSLTNRIE